MQEILIHKLYAYTRENNPELLLSLQKEQTLADWLKQKVEAIDGTINDLLSAGLPAYEIEEQCMALLTEELKPSKYQFIKNIFEEDFEKTFRQLELEGRLSTTIIDMIPACEPVFELFEDRFLRYAVIGIIYEHLK